MIIGINALTSYVKVQGNSGKNGKNIQNNTTFKSRPLKIMRNAGLSLVAATILSTVSSCSNFKQKVSDDTKENQSNTEAVDTITTDRGMLQKDNNVQRHYHYFPRENSVDADNYDWSEEIYPDGRVEKDSFGYNISISPTGERTVIHTEIKEFGNTVTKELPDGTKIVRNNYYTDVPKEILYVETEYWANGKMRERNYYDEHPVNEEEPDGEFVVEKSTYKYNDKEVLLAWETNQIDSMRSEKYNKYDKKGRLIYDDVKNEKYEYKKGAKNPFRAISEYDGCKRITLYNDSGDVKKIFFEAIDGTITEAEVK